MRSASVTANPIELSKIINGDAMFRHLLAELQRRMGKTLSGADLTTLHGIYSSLGLPAEVLMIMITHVFEETARRYGEGHRPGVRKLQKEAVFWSESGINTVERAESFVKSRDEKRQGQTVIAKMLSRGGRQLTDSEEKYIGRWLEMGFPPETVYKAYDRTVLNTGDLKWKYMDSILANWHKAGLHQPAEVEGYIPADDSKPARPRASGGARGTAAPFEPGANERDSVEWVKSMGRRKKGVDGGGL